MYTAVADASATAIVRQALEAGIRLIDTAPLYGYGLAEDRLGTALTGVRRDAFILGTKVGRVLRPRTSGDPTPRSYDGTGPLFVDAPAMHADFDFSYDATLRCVEESLHRLRTDRLDIALIHDPDDYYEAAQGGAYLALQRLKDEHVIDAIGVGMNQARMLTRFVEGADLDLVLLAGEYTLLDQSALTDLLPACLARDVGVVLGGIYNTGVLADPSPGSCYKYKVAPPPVVERAQRMKAVCDRHDVPLRAAAIQFPFAHPAVSTVLVGVRSTEELVDNATMLGHPLPSDLWVELRAENLIPEHVPLPA